MMMMMSPAKAERQDCQGHQVVVAWCVKATALPRVRVSRVHLLRIATSTTLSMKYISPFRLALFTLRSTPHRSRSINCALRQSYNMPSKQGTLKYVRSGQQTLGCARMLIYFGKQLTSPCSKWFSGGAQNGRPAEPEQTKLKLKVAEDKENKDVDMTDAGLAKGKTAVDDSKKHGMLGVFSAICIVLA